MFLVGNYHGVFGEERDGRVVSANDGLWGFEQLEKKQQLFLSWAEKSIVVQRLKIEWSSLLSPMINIGIWIHDVVQGGSGGKFGMM